MSLTPFVQVTLRSEPGALPAIVRLRIVSETPRYVAGLEVDERGNEIVYICGCGGATAGHPSAAHRSGKYRIIPLSQTDDVVSLKPDSFGGLVPVSR